MTHFPAVAIPANALRRSWLLDQLRFARVGKHLLDILAQLKPGVARHCDPTDVVEIYTELCIACAALFPINDPCGDYETADQLLYDGIPVILLGYIPYENESLALALISLDIIWQGGEDESMYQAFSDNSEWNAGNWWRGVIPRESYTRPKPPRGREWRGVWRALPDAIAYVQNATGYLFADLTYENELENPNWHIDEVRSLAAQWKEAKPILDSVQKFTNYIDADYRNRLPLLDSVLRGEPRALAQVTQPKPKRIKTLAEIFNS